MAGVPPLVGFFTKLLVLLSLLNTSFYFLYVFYFVLLFLGLFYYMQNVRFLQTSARVKA